MSIKRKITLLILTAAVLACTVAGLLFARFTANAYTDGVQITSSAGDTFQAREETFDKNTSFVFSATLNFGSGDAAALTFGETEKGLFGFNADRAGNFVKLLYFTKTGDGFAAEELKREYFIGNDKMTDAERAMIEPKVRQVEEVRLKVVVTVDGKAANLECYADGIRRFAFTDGSAPAAVLDLNTAFGELTYEGGNIGYNVCNADVTFTDIEVAEHDYSYYSESYRNQFHYSPFAHWNNDPNGLVYYNGYYHLYYQHYPFAKAWGDMYWGHARSTDLLHWENLPVCLYPEKDGANGNRDGGDGYMWSGSVRIYHKGESTVVEQQNWFGDISDKNGGDGVGLIGFYTRDGARQNQMVMSSDDGGLSWTKRVLIPSHDILGLGAEKADCRDPKVFEFDDNGNKIFGMILTGMGSDDVWFLKSTDFVNWTTAGGFKARVPLVNTDATNGVECPDVAFLRADDGITKTVITLSGRGYIVGELKYESGNFKMYADGVDLSELGVDEIAVKQMDFGPDSYATQTFYIDDGEYAGKYVAMSWFSGVPGASATVDNGFYSQLRSRWNGGMTVPVVLGLHYDGANGYTLTQTPVTKDGAANKIQLASVSNFAAESGKNILENITATAFEIDAQISNPEGGAVAFRVRTGAGEYTEIGWNETDGYYVDRTYTATGNVVLPNYAQKYRAKTADGENLSFYILCDEGSLEAFCGEGRAPFYVTAFYAPQSDGMSFVSEKDVVFTKLNINKISSVWRSVPAENYLNIVNDKIELDLTLCTRRDVAVHGSGEIVYSVEEGADCISLVKTLNGLTVYSEKAGKAVIKATCGDKVSYIEAVVYGGEPDADCVFGNVTAGDWYKSADGYIGSILAGDAYIFSEREGGNFLYSAKFDLTSGVAAALVFRAKTDMSQFIMANYDHNAGLVKLWSNSDPVFDTEEERKADYAKRNISIRLNDLTDVTLSVVADGKNIKVYLNQQLMIDYLYKTEIPEEGLFGLNVCAADVTFKIISVTDNINADYSAGDVSWRHTDTAVFTVINRTLNNRLVDGGFYTAEGRQVVLSQNYMASLPQAGEYILEVRGQNCLYEIELNVEAIPSAVWQDAELQENTNAIFFIGNDTGGKVTVNGKELDDSLYRIEGMQLIISAQAFKAGENEVTYSGGLQAKVTVAGYKKLEVNYNEGNGDVILIVLFSIVGAVLAGECALIAVITLKKSKNAEESGEENKDGGND